MATLERAVEIATKAHEGQTDRGGAPYIRHCLRVMERMPTEEMKIAAVLHDVVEDTAVTLEDLRREGFSEAVVKAVDALTRREGEDYPIFIMRTACNHIGLNVKLADLLENCDLSRIPDPGPEDFERLKKYQDAIRAIRILFLGETILPDNGPCYSTRPGLPDGAEIVSEGGFLCTACGNEAGHFFFVREGNRPYTVIHSFIGGRRVYGPWDERPNGLEELVMTGNVRAIYERDFEMAPFYCPRCDACYCGVHYLHWDVLDEQLALFRDCIMGRCPAGHTRMLED